MKYYIHKEVDSLLTIKSIKGSVATCYKVDEPKAINIYGKYVYQVIICDVEGLKEYDCSEDYSLFAHNC